MIARCIVILLLLMSPGVARAGSGHTYALVVNGINKDPQDRLAKDQALRDLRERLLSTVKIDPTRLVVLDASDNNAPPTRDTLAKAINTFATAASVEDRFLFYYMGQANAVTGTLRLNLPGDDVTHEEVVDWLSRVKAGAQLVVLDCPCAGLAAKALAGAGRIIVCATTEVQVYSTRFSRYFVAALTRPQSDTNSDGRISVLEAFTAAAREIEQWHRDRQVLPTETPCLEDNGDGLPSERPWRYAVEAVDGLAASKFFLAEN
jgi:hypothetical protein